MTEIVYLFIGIIVLLVIFALLWRAGVLAASLAPLGPTGQTLVMIVLLILAALVILWLFGSYIHLPGRT